MIGGKFFLTKKQDPDLDLHRWEFENLVSIKMIQIVRHF